MLFTQKFLPIIYKVLQGIFSLYRVIHKSVKHLKNLQQMDYATHHGNSYVDRETVEVFLRKSPRT